MATTEKTAKNVQVYWDEKGPGWFVDLTYTDLSERKINLWDEEWDEECDDWDVDDAIRAACWQLGLTLEPHDFIKSGERVAIAEFTR